MNLQTKRLKQLTLCLYSEACASACNVNSEICDLHLAIYNQRKEADKYLDLVISHNSQLKISNKSSK